MSSANQGAEDAIPSTFRTLANYLPAMARELEPALRGLMELAAPLESLTRSLATAAPLVQAVARELARLDTAENLLKQGWVPNHTTPYDLVAECGGRRCQTADVPARLLHRQLGRSPYTAGITATFLRHRRRSQGYVRGSA